ncbi:phage baseplate protein [Aetokthonos hydrillicola Thurmond2011]|jgi:hypothetical protein|uniref:Phage baseplate protein n=1 Tax=Aetokthonos hydrillicola Thurmond2011 TaxID=2712845 RepID=A0AAP5I6P0_9CYAN|nr:phage baseplate protein [Aetokthonos hydrillicola]MBO3457559.1 phage baseplate protein [Aetokthonos hydrillicola CCALA 1050]MBW4590893.1 phage baseplate protein [Aetokthonos hydrillicola CCALA 1050]MDR9894759.1 phage baseplate protein [Aetokthonos hydrillicola Thurmond2011]
MRSLTAQQILQIWEIGQSQHPIDRALTLLCVACPNQSLEELAALSIGQRDAYLLTLREMTLGSKIESYAECSQCGERLEFTMNVGDIRVCEPISVVQQEYFLNWEDYQLRFRLPNSQDLAAVVGYQDVNMVRHIIGQRCVLQTKYHGDDLTDHNLPPALMSQLAAHIAEHDPQAEILLNLTCLACSHSWQVLFDIVTFFWSELSHQAKRLLHEVHTLARYYGWGEVDILSMSQFRRQFYLDLVNS